MRNIIRLTTSTLSLIWTGAAWLHTIATVWFTYVRRTVSMRDSRMSGARDNTSIGGFRSEFPPTEWTRVIEPALGKAIQDELVLRYWKPIYCFLRRKGYANEEAKDLTQGFFTEIILDSNLFRGIHRSKGKFRTILLTALDHYIIDVARHEKRKKRRPQLLTSLEEDFYMPDESLANPEDAFDYAWAVEILQDVLKTLEAECRQDGLSQHWEIFKARVLGPSMGSDAAPSLPELCARMGIDSEAKASNMIVTVKRRFKDLLKCRLRKYVDSDSDVDREIRRLGDLFGTGPA